MAHFARINENNVVIDVVVVPDSDEHRGEAFLHDIGLDGRWIQTSITNRIRKVFAQPGFLYLPEKDAFQPAKSFPSWSFDETTWQWIAPVPMPTDGKQYLWNEEILEWQDASSPPPSWIDGQPPFLPPNDGKPYKWNESTLSWEEIPVVYPPSFIQDETGRWVPPIPIPEDGNIYTWNEETLSWVDTGQPIPPRPVI